MWSATSVVGVMPDLPPQRLNFGDFYRATVAPLRRFLFRLTGSRSEAQDLAHDAYAKVFPAMQEKEVSQPQAFLYTTARHLALDQIKRRTRSPLQQSPIESDAAASRAPGVESVVMAREEWALMERAIAELPPGCRRVLLLRMVERHSHEEIAQQLGLARSSVEKHLMRAVRLLQAALRESGARGESVVVPISKPTGTGR
jgi:RNA polymerase sigma-70 factor (ECF subfamily)